MSNQSDNVALSLEQILLGIADSLTEAQATLKNVQPYDPYGRPNTIYELPYLDFKLQVTSEFQSVQSEESESGQSSAPSGEGLFRKKSKYPTEFISFKPIKTSESKSVQNEIISTISGRFVANVPNQGLPQMILTLSTTQGVIESGWQKYQLKVLVSNSAGERLKGATVELNFDEIESEQINGVEINPPTFDRAEYRTDHEGEALFEISLPILNYNQGRTFMFSVHVGPVTKEFSISKPLP